MARYDTLRRKMFALLREARLDDRDRMKIGEIVLGREPGSLSTFKGMDIEDLERVVDALVGWRVVEDVRFVSGLHEEAAWESVKRKFTSLNEGKEMAAKKKTQAVATMDSSKALEAVIGSLSGEHQSAVRLMGESSSFWGADEVISTGITGLDMALGIGGIPRGRITEISGNPGSGKTTTAIVAAAQAQKAGDIVVYVDGDNKFSVDLARKVGLDLGEVFLVRPESLQHFIDITKSLLTDGVSALDGNGGEKRSFFIVVDSVSSLTPMEIFVESAEQQTVALDARYWSKHARVLVNLLGRTGSTMLMTNQTRTQVGNQYEPITTTGGRALKYYSSVKIQSRASMDSAARRAGEVESVDFDYKVTSNSFAVAYKQAKTTLNARGIDPVLDVAHAALSAGMIQKDFKVDDDQKGVTAKKNWYTLQLTSGMKDAIARDVAAHGADPVEGEFLTAYHEGKFLSKLSNYPELVKEVKTQMLADCQTARDAEIEEAISYRERHDLDVAAAIESGTLAIESADASDESDDTEVRSMSALEASLQEG